MSLNLAVYVVEVWHEGRWTCTPASGHLYVYSRRMQAEAMRRYLRGQKIKARVTPAVLS